MISPYLFLLWDRSGSNQLLTTAAVLSTELSHKSGPEGPDMHF